MKKLKVKELKLIRNVLVFVGIAVGFFIWRAMPAFFRNSPMLHVGNGKYGSRIGALPLLLFPLVSFIPYKQKEEYHSDDEEEKAKLLYEWKKSSAVYQVGMAIAMDLVTWFSMFMGIIFS